MHCNNTNATYTGPGGALNFAQAETLQHKLLLCVGSRGNEDVKRTEETDAVIL